MFGSPRGASGRMRQAPAAVRALARTGHSAAASASGLAWAGRDAHRNRGDVLASLPEERVTGELQGRLSARLLRFASRRSSSAARSLAAAARAAAWALMAAAVRGVLVLGDSAALRICDPSVPASRADRYSKGVAETENKAKKKLVSITTETSM